MKNLRKVLAFTLALAMLLSTMTFTTFAASKEVEALANLKLLLNTTDAEVEQELTRSVGLAMVLKALGYAQADADAKAADNKFVDMDDAAWAKGYAALAEELKISNGTSVEPKLFSPMQKLDQKSFVTFMLRALGYDADKAWAEAGALAKEAGLVAGELAEGAFKKGDAAVVMYNALLAKVQGDEKGRTLAEKLVDEKKLDKDLAVANGLMSAEPEKLMVAEVKADNLREVTVMFNGTVNKDSAEKHGNYKLKGKNVGSAKVLEDGKTVVLTLAGETALENKKETKLTVTNVKNVAGVAMEKQEVAFVPVDVDYPTVKDVVFTGPKSLDITFSEPIQKGQPTVSLKDGKSTFSSKAERSKSDERVLSVTLYTSLKDGVDYNVCVGDPKNNNSYVKDFAGYPNVYFDGAYTYNADKTAPEATITKVDQKYVVVEFNKPVTGITAEHFYHSFADYKAKNVYVKDEFKDDNKVDRNKPVSKVWVVFYQNKNDNPLPAGTVPVTILAENKGKVKIQDNWKNAFATVTINVDVVADREAPEVVSAEVTGEKEIKVTFNEAVSNLETRSNYKLLDKDGKEVETGSKLSPKKDGDKAVKLGLSKSYAGKTLTLVVKGVKDASLYENMMSEYTTTLEFTDKSWDGIKDDNVRLKVIQPSTDKKTWRYVLFVTFEEDMDDSATDVANYKFKKIVGNEEKITGIKGTADFYEGKNNVVAFELTYELDKDGNVKEGTDVHFITNNGTGLVAGVKLLVNNKVKDLAGNTTGNFQVEKPIQAFDPDAQPMVKTVEATETGKLVVKFDTELVTADAAEFTVPGYKVGSFVIKDAKTVEIYLDDEKLMPTDANDVKVKFVAKKDTLNNVISVTTDIFGRALRDFEQAAEDKINPAIAAFKLGVATDAAVAFQLGQSPDSDLEGTPVLLLSEFTDVADDNADDTVKVKVRFTEKIMANSLSLTTFAANNGFSVTEVKLGAAAPAVQDDVVVITLTKKKASKGDVKDLTITQQGAILDTQNNVLKGNSEAMSVKLRLEGIVLD